MRADIVPGARFPDYELTDHTRTRRRLSELQGNDPMILILSRGDYCPKDHQQHLELAAFYSKIAVARSEEHTSELQSRLHLVCRLLLEKKKSTSVLLCLRAGQRE